jgi:hypothetical protein
VAAFLDKHFHQFNLLLCFIQNNQVESRGDDTMYSCVLLLAAQYQFTDTRMDRQTFQSVVHLPSIHHLSHILFQILDSDLHRDLKLVAANIGFSDARDTGTQWNLPLTGISTFHQECVCSFTSTPIYVFLVHC